MGTAITPPIRPQAPPRPTMWRFVLLSLLLHLGILWTVQQGREPLPAPAVSQPTHGITVHLLQGPQPSQPKAAAIVPGPVKKTAAEKAPSEGVAPLTAKATPSEKAAEPAQAKSPAALNIASAPAQRAPQQPGHKAPSTSVTTADERAQQERLMLTLQQALARHFRYPLLARKRGWQGEVLLAFRLESDGRILDARIARSSGYRLLDRAALDALGRIKGIDNGAQQGLTLQLPVIYRLEG